MTSPKSKYSRALYALIESRNHQTIYKTISEWRDALGVPRDALKLYGSFKQRAWLPAVAEINSLTEFRIEWTELKRVRQVNEIRADIFRKSAKNISKVDIWLDEPQDFTQTNYDWHAGIGLTQVCSRCSEKLPITDFHNRGKQGRRPDCKHCYNAYKKEYRKHNPHTVTRDVKKWIWQKKRRRDRIGLLKQRMGCVDCGYTDNPVALHFDHINPLTKFKNVSSLYNFKLKVLFMEIRKCVVRCANCHAIKTYEGKHHAIKKDDTDYVNTNEFHTGSRR